MYRELAIPPGAAVTEFVYAPRNRAAGQRSLLLYIFSPLVFVLVLGGCMTWLGWDPGPSALVGAAVMAVVVALVFLRARRSAASEVTRLRVDGHELEVWAPGSASASRGLGSRIPLVDLRDVVLDSESIERVIDGTSAVPALRFSDPRVAPPLDVARIVLSFRDGSVVPLSSERFSHLETAEAYGKMRVFLRKNGWQPVDERET